MGTDDWYHVSTHGAILFCIAARQSCTAKELAHELSLSNRQVWGIIRDLRRSGMLRVRKEGRRHHYVVNLDAPLLHPVVEGYSLRHIMGPMVRQTRHRKASAAS